jgi:hypothetical protein
MREIRLSGSEGGVALIAPSLPLSTFQLHGSNFALKAPAAVWDN